MAACQQRKHPVLEDCHEGKRGMVAAPDALGQFFRYPVRQRAVMAEQTEDGGVQHRRRIRAGRPCHAFDF
jgi:hypothetical protein